ncbi:MAG: class I SAM-dependent methyltransferase [Alphaproteobacteria bacterium]|jgi:cyclopropane fatty-acyl-phospholipid synthase-like methyltransferase|nr:class I SAM-dependent methyltransferase [Alphaproteobacteria bacterium]
MEDNARLWDIFLEVQRGLPRQGPGCADATRRALSLCSGLPDRPRVLDIGCGPGMQTMVLAQDLDAHITAVDLHEEYLEQLRARVAAAEISDRVELRTRDMNDLALPEHHFDLIWAEGSAYIMGFAQALKAWKPLLKPGGYLAATELVWLTPDPPAEAATFFTAEYPAMTDVAGVAELFRAQGYDVTGHFTLPDAAWWDDYYAPLEAKLPKLRETYRDDDEALSVVEMTQREINMRKRFGDSYGYEFFVGQPGP